MDDTLHEDVCLIKPARAAQLLDTSRPTIYKLVSKGLLPSIQWSADGERPTVRIHIDDLKEFIDRHRRPHDRESSDKAAKPRLVSVDND